jgi:hypothetical protein
MTPKSTEPESNQGGHGDFNPDTAQSVRRELHWLEILNFSGQIILAIVGIIAVCIYGRQLREMNRTNDLTQQALRGSDMSLNRTLEHMDASTGQTSRLAAATEKANANVLNADRPWVGGFIQVVDFEAGKSPEAICTFVNGGRRPAYIEKATCGSEMDKLDINTIRDPRKPGTSIMLPGLQLVTRNAIYEGGTANFIQDGSKMTQSLVDEFTLGHVHMKVWAKLSIEISKRGRFTTLLCVCNT